MKRHKHSLSHEHKFSCNQGQLVPIGCVEVLPGDSFRHSTIALIRTLPLMTPVMHKVNVRIHHWFVPNRLIWDEWQDFITGGPDGFNDSVHPYITTPPGGPTIGSNMDYMGLPPEATSDQVNALPFRAYNLIYNEWYRDQDLQAPLVISKASGSDTTTNMLIQNCNWEKDYFTTCRPWTQKGPEITLPLTGDAPVYGKNMPFDGNAAGNNLVNILDDDGDLHPLLGYSTSTPIYGGSAAAAGTGQLFADMNGVGSASINDLREAFALQRYEEARARYGSRYTEYLAYLGVRSSDARLQRPEYLGGGRQTIQFSEVLQTAEGTDPVATLRGHGIGAVRSNRYTRFFEEHGFVITLMSVQPRTVYTQGINKMFLRKTKEDYFQKELQHIGQMEVYNRELYAGHTSPDGVFGYQDRYDDYRRIPSRVSGEFRTTLDDWHMARIFDTNPALNSSFVTSNPTDRIYAVGTENANSLQVAALHSIKSRRLVAKTGSSFIY